MPDPRYLDLHAMTWREAREALVEAYNTVLPTGLTMDVVHGYGSSGTGGVLRKAVRTFLSDNGVPFTTGEVYDGNQGHTVISPGPPLPTAEDALQRAILEYCETPRTPREIASKFFRHGDPVVKAALNSLKSRRLLRVDDEGTVKKLVRW